MITEISLHRPTKPNQYIKQFKCKSTFSKHIFLASQHYWIFRYFCWNSECKIFGSFRKHFCVTLFTAKSFQIKLVLDFILEGINPQRLSNYSKKSVVQNLNFRSCFPRLFGFIDSLAQKNFFSFPILEIWISYAFYQAVEFFNNGFSRDGFDGWYYCGPRYNTIQSPQFPPKVPFWQ